MNEAEKAIRDRIGYLEDNLHRYKIASMCSQQMEDDYKRKIAELTLALQKVKS